METQLNEIEARILGSLMEKSLTTPEYYPLSLNALVNACNQKSARDPVVDYDESAVQAALDELCRRDIVFESKLSRVPKYEEHFSQPRQLVPKEIALLCLLLLRGPQTVGELRTRSARMYAFETLEDVTAALDNLVEYGLARQLGRLPGRKEPRYDHTLCRVSEETGQPIESEEKEKIPDPTLQHDLALRMDQMEQTVTNLQEELAELKRAFEQFKKQFE